MRHGKAESFGDSDQDRALTRRGRADAEAVGRHLAEVGAVPDAALVSTAARTVDTWERLAAACGSTAQARFDGALYSGSAEVVAESVRGLPERARTAILIGHNPSAANLCNLLDDGEGDPAATTALLRGFPTSAMTIFEVGVPWSRIGPETGRLVEFYVP